MRRFRVQSQGAPALPHGTIRPELARAVLWREFERFCAVRRLRVVDHTDQGGNLRVVTDDKDESVNKQLKAWSFQYKEGRGWWRKEG